MVTAFLCHVLLCYVLNSYFKKIVITIKFVLKYLCYVLKYFKKILYTF